MDALARVTITDRLKNIFHVDDINKISTLYFTDSRNGDDIIGRSPFNSNVLAERIMECLELNKKYFSANAESHLVETSNRANRSVIDIWRHLKHYNTELTIFEVMRECFKLSYELEMVASFICGDIGRRVFVIEEIDDQYCVDVDEADTLLIDFMTWKNI